MADSVKYQHFQTLLQAFENAHTEKDKNTAQVTVTKIWKKMKMDFSTGNELDSCDRESRVLLERGLRFKLLVFDCDMFNFVILKISLKKINLFQFFF